MNNKILIDAFGGDNSPSEIIAGAIDALNINKNFTAVFVGKEQIIAEELKKYKYDKSRVEIINANDVITCEEEPTVAIRKKPDSSICVAFRELKENDDCKGFVSAGSTGAVLVGATLKLGRAPGVSRPALTSLFPSVVEGKNMIMLDLGANADCKSNQLCQFAVMGTAYAKALGIENPRVALLSNGTEDEKGNALCHETFEMLKNLEGINFIGNVEARDLLFDVSDVVVTDGFSGNVALKSMEGMVKAIFKILKEDIKKSCKAKLGALLLKDSFKRLSHKLDYNTEGGALFLGVKKTVIKAHGASDRLAFRNAVLQAVNHSEFDLNFNFSEEISK